MNYLKIFILVITLSSCNGNTITTPLNAKNKFVQFNKKEKFLEDNKLFYPGIGDPKMLLVLTNKINKTSNDFKKVSESKNPTSKQYQEVIQSNLNTFKDIYTNLDTEDRERICSYIEELMDIVNLESSNGLLNEFMYSFDPTIKN
jgi:hypothetical protein